MSNDAFKESFKYYKSKDPPPDLSNLLQLKSNSSKLIQRKTLESFNGDDFLKPSNTWEVFNVTPCPGIIAISNPFTHLGQQKFITKCLQDYPLPPNPTNLTTKKVPSEVKENWWKYATRDPVIRDALRWTTLGYHHDWDTKIYRDDMKNEFPGDLKALCQTVAAVLGFELYEPEAAIVNYYPLNGTLAGHTDHSEYCREPLFSFSFGQSAVFLIGGKTREVKPEGIWLKSGDILVMTGDSRECYHGVPKILKTEETPWNSFEDTRFEDYLKSNRININVRQVFKK